MKNKYFKNAFIDILLVIVLPVDKFNAEIAKLLLYL